MNTTSLKALLSTAIFSALLSTNAFSAESVNVYSYRQPFLIDPIFESFTKQTGIKVNTVFAKKGLVERLKSEGTNSPADLLLTSDFNTITAAMDANVAQPVSSDVLSKNIPAEFRDPEGHWFGLTNRARLIVVSKERVTENRPERYEDLANAAYKGKICTRSGKHNYMVALTASVIAHAGQDAAKDWLAGMKDNLARKPQGNDRAQVKAISQGECDIAIINSYYMGSMLADEEQIPWANSVDLIFPNQADRGTHMNISGVLLTKSTPNKSNAIKLMEYLSSADAQEIYAEVNFEYPINKSISPSELVQSWGEFTYDTLPLAQIAKFRNAASRLADEVNYDH
ncbi:UNVERIFIED_CONTAM: hypothetical protein GTU68_058216 [Idotea baltica]|nr:hypothetical protein [Idotea baltica]